MENFETFREKLCACQADRKRLPIRKTERCCQQDEVKQSSRQIRQTTKTELSNNQIFYQILQKNLDMTRYRPKN